MEEYFTVKEGTTTYVCRKVKDGCMILAHHKNERWLRYRNPLFWEWKPEEECLRPTRRVAKAEVTAIFLMGKSEAEI